MKIRNLKTEIFSSLESTISIFFQKELNTLKDKCEILMQNSYSRIKLKTKTKLLANSQQHYVTLNDNDLVPKTAPSSYNENILYLLELFYTTDS